MGPDLSLGNQPRHISLILSISEHEKKDFFGPERLHRPVLAKDVAPSLAQMALNGMMVQGFVKESRVHSSLKRDQC